MIDKAEFHQALATLLAQVEWIPTGMADDAEPDLPYATHEGVLHLPGLGSVVVYQLNTGERVFDGETIERLLGLDATDEEAADE
jgi:hypothetical protein